MAPYPIRNGLSRSKSNATRTKIHLPFSACLNTPHDTQTRSLRELAVPRTVAPHLKCKMVFDFHAVRADVCMDSHQRCRMRVFSSPPQPLSKVCMTKSCHTTCADRHADVLAIVGDHLQTADPDLDHQRPDVTVKSMLLPHQARAPMRSRPSKACSMLRPKPPRQPPCRRCQRRVPANSIRLYVKGFGRHAQGSDSIS